MCHLKQVFFLLETVNTGKQVVIMTWINFSKINKKSYRVAKCKRQITFFFFCFFNLNIKISRIILFDVFLFIINIFFSIYFLQWEKNKQQKPLKSCSNILKITVVMMIVTQEMFYSLVFNRQQRWGHNVFPLLHLYIFKRKG